MDRLGANNAVNSDAFFRSLRSLQMRRLRLELSRKNYEKQSIREKWLRFTAETNALDFLERAGQFIQQTESDIKAWKWVILSLHGALYGFAICACRSTDYENIIRRTKKGTERLITLEEALAICQDRNWMGRLYGGKPLEFTDDQKHSIKILKQSLRNNFEHYIPKGWSI